MGSILVQQCTRRLANNNNQLRICAPPYQLDCQKRFRSFFLFGFRTNQKNTTAQRFSTTAAATYNQGDTNDICDYSDSDGLDGLPDLSPAMRSRIRTMKSRHDEIMKQLHDGGDQTTLGKELSSLSGISSLCDKVSEIHTERESLTELLNEISIQESSSPSSSNNDGDDDDESNKEMIHEINDELSQLELKLQPLTSKMLNFVVPLLNPDFVDELMSSDAGKRRLSVFLITETIYITNN